VFVRHTRPPAAGRFARRPGPNPDHSRRSNEGWRAKLPAALQRPLAWQAPVAGRAVAGAGKAAFTATRSLRDRLRRGLPQTLTGRVVAIIATVALFTGATWVTTRSSLLDVGHFRVQGATVVTPDQAVAGAGLHRGQPMFSVDTAAAERRLSHLPWVKTAVVERAFPDTVRIILTERTAAAMAVRPAGGWVLVDGEGRVLAERPDRPGDVPEIIGAGPPPPPGAELTAARPALDVIAALPEAVRRQVTNATLDGDAVTLHTGVREIRIGPPTQLAAKVAALSVLLERVGSRSVAVLDVRVPQAPVVVPTPASAATSTAAPGRGATAPAPPGKPRD
jgi:cell division protein FtsQ